MKPVVFMRMKLNKACMTPVADRYLYPLCIVIRGFLHPGIVLVQQRIPNIYHNYYFNTCKKIRNRRETVFPFYRNLSLNLMTEEQ